MSELPLPVQFLADWIGTWLVRRQDRLIGYLRIVPLGEAHVRRSISEYMRHYHIERNHQGLGNVLIDGGPSPANMNDRVERRERLGGLLNFYTRAAA